VGVGFSVGLGDGPGDGSRVGFRVGFLVGLGVGLGDELLAGLRVGLLVGLGVGSGVSSVGKLVFGIVGVNVTNTEGGKTVSDVGESVGNSSGGVGRSGKTVGERVRSAPPDVMGEAVGGDGGMGGESMGGREGDLMSVGGSGCGGPYCWSGAEAGVSGGGLLLLTAPGRVD